MSRDLYVSKLDLEKFRAVQGSGDEELLRRLLEDKRVEIEQLDRHFRELTAPHPYVPLAVALEQIINGRIDEGSTPRFPFESAAALIADHLGEPLENTWLFEAKESFWREVDLVIRKRRRAAGVPKSVWPAFHELLERGPLLAVPLDPELPLGTGYLTASEVQEAASATERVDLEDAEGLDDLTWPEEALEAAWEYRGWLREASADGRGLFFHC
jgi:hypothetical protein